MSPGWQSSALQMASRVDSRIARAFPFFRMEMLAIVMPTFSASSVTLIFRFASITSILMMMAISDGRVPGLRSAGTARRLSVRGCRGGGRAEDEHQEDAHGDAAR